MKYSVLILSAFILFSAPVNAQDINGQCKVAVENFDFDTETEFEFCDYYDRRFEYKKRRDEFRENLNDRRANYQAQRQVVIDAYQAKEKAFHGF